MGKKKTNKKILFLAIWKSRWYILKYYPKMIYMANHPSKYTEQERYDYTIKYSPAKVITAEKMR